MDTPPGPFKANGYTLRSNMVESINPSSVKIRWGARCVCCAFELSLYVIILPILPLSRFDDPSCPTVV